MENVARSNEVAMAFDVFVVSSSFTFNLALKKNRIL